MARSPALSKAIAEAIRSAAERFRQSGLSSEAARLSAVGWVEQNHERIARTVKGMKHRTKRQSAAPTIGETRC